MATRNSRRVRRGGRKMVGRRATARKSTAKRRLNAASKRKRATPTVKVAARRVAASARRLAKDLVTIGARRARAGVARGARSAGQMTATALGSVADRVES